jgi:HPt (histidine-containing phosphotransfer) domain-containing protein
MPFHFIISENDTTVDLSVLQDLVGDDAASLKPIINLFLSNLPVTIAKMKDCCNAKDWENLYKTAHYAKSSLSVIQVDQLYQAAMQIEINAKNKTDLDDIPQMIGQMEQHYAVSEKLLRKELEQL